MAQCAQESFLFSHFKREVHLTSVLGANSHLPNMAVGVLLFAFLLLGGMQGATPFSTVYIKDRLDRPSTTPQPPEAYQIHTWAEKLQPKLDRYRAILHFLDIPVEKFCLYLVKVVFQGQYDKFRCRPNQLIPVYFGQL